MSAIDGFCVICKEAEEPLVTVTERGFKGLLDFSIERKDDETTKYLKEKNEIDSCTSIQVHEKCRKWYNNRKRIETVEKRPARKRSSRNLNGNEFDWKGNCCFCGAICEPKRKDRECWHVATTMEIGENIQKHCEDRIKENNDDEWAHTVLSRVKSCIDFVAAEARYHKTCYLRFTSPASSSSKVISPNRGRKVNDEMTGYLEKACEWLEQDADVHTLREVREKMVEFANGKDVYGQQYIKKLLEGRYKEHICFASEYGKADVIYFTKFSDFLINERFKDKANSTEEEASRIIKLAAILIKAEIREFSYDKDIYPNSEKIKDLNWNPALLQKFLEVLIPSKLKQESIGQCVVKATRREVIPPLLFGIGVDLDQTIGSKWLIRHLSRLGFSITPEEVTLYRQSVLESNQSPLNLLPEGSFVQWSADNVDHNIATLDGKGTFHGMGIVASVTPAGEFINEDNIRRLKKRKPVSEIVKHRGIDIIEYDGSNAWQNLPKITPLNMLKVKDRFAFDLEPDIFWHICSFFSSSTKPRPLWSGFMQQLYCKSTDHSYSKSDVVLLPIIDLQPTNLNCIYSTLLYIQNQAAKLNIETPVVTFDQPLWYKALGIITEKNLNIVCRLGGFHTLMSFIGSIGYVMGGSGLEDALSQVYSENSVAHMLSGKAYSRADRGYILVESALSNILITDLLCMTTDNQKNEASQLQDEELELVKRCFENNGQIDESCSTILRKLDGLLTEKKEQLKKESRTAKLWINFMDYVSIMKLFIKAERLGDWEMHLSAIHSMLNLFAASGHYHYAKSARVYLQQMLELPEKHPSIYQLFKDQGYHTIRRSNRHWAGLWSDLIIEQVMMRSLKSRGGLTRGRGFQESTRHQWVHTAHQCAVIHQTMTSITNTSHCNSEQHVELGKTRNSRDTSDLTIIQEWFTGHNPFEVGEELRSLSTGIYDNEAINCDDAEKVGKEQQKKINNISLNEAKLKRSEKVKTIESLFNSVKISEKKSITIKPIALFLRLIAIAQRESDLGKFFHYELTSFPMSLFKDGMMRKPNKSVLRNALLISKSNVNEDSLHVLDGGALLHKVRWKIKSTFDEVCTQYSWYVEKVYGKCLIVFDGYNDNPSTKDHEHSRRSLKKKRCAKVSCNNSNKITIRQDDFLSSSENKASFIKLLSGHLLTAGNTVINCEDDADTQIAKCALEAAKTGRNVNVVCDDTDVAILLLHHWNNNMADITFTSERTKATYSVKSSLSDINPVVKNHLLVLHAWTGCDTTSAIHQKGKTSLLKKLERSQQLQDMLTILDDVNADQIEVAEAGVSLFQFMYGGKDSLTNQRYRKFMDMAAKGEIQPENLPPTERAAIAHSFRVHQQAVVWKTLNEDVPNPLDWGWKQDGSFYFPVMTDDEVAPAELLKFIRCGCKSRNNMCGTMLCSCRRYGLKCVSACGKCRGEICENKEDFPLDEIDDEFENDGNIFDILAEV